jgi:selenocysteine lyase/cysteine desulfurase
MLGLCQVEIIGCRKVASERLTYVIKLLHLDWQAHFLDDHIFVSHYQLGVRVSFGFYSNMSDVRSFVSSLQRGYRAGFLGLSFNHGP